MRILKSSVYVAFWGAAGALGMVWVIHIVSLQLATLTDYVDLWSFNFLPQARRIAPPGNVVLFNAWMMATSAAESIILGWVLMYVEKRLSR